MATIDELNEYLAGGNQDEKVDSHLQLWAQHFDSDDDIQKFLEQHTAACAMAAMEDPPMPLGEVISQAIFGGMCIGAALAVKGELVA